MTIKVPENFKPENLKGVQRFRKDKKENLIDGLNIVVSRIVEISESVSGKEKLLKTGFITLNREYLSSILLSEARVSDVLKILVSEKIIVVDRNHIIGKKSNGYRLEKVYMGTALVEVEIKSKTIKVAFKDSSKIKDAKDNNLLSDLNHLTKWLQHPDFEYDENRYHHFIENYGFKLRKKITQNQTKNETEKEEHILRLALSIKSQKEKVQNNNKAKNNPIIDKTGQRLHTEITNLKKATRYFMKFGGEHLTNIDLKSSQPYLLNILLNKSFWKGNRTGRIRIKTIYPELYQLIKPTQTPPTTPHLPSTYLKSLIRKGFQKSNFSKIDWENDFYNQFMDLVRRDFASTPEILNDFTSRNKTKHNMMLILFDKNALKYPISIPFKKLFPSVYDILVNLKRIALNDHDNILPVLLQRIESHLFLRIITKEISIKYPEIPLFTIHDSILTTEKYSHIVRDFMFQILKQYVGKNPGIEVEQLNPSFLENSLDDLVNEGYEKLIEKKKNNLLDLYTSDYWDKIKHDAMKPLFKDIPQFGDSKVLSTRFIPVP